MLSMKSFSLFFLFLCMLFLAACGGTKTPKAEADIVGDDDLLTDELIPDEEEDVEPDETDLDTKDTDIKDGDIKDTDITDVDIKDADIKDGDLVDEEPDVDEPVIDAEPDTDEPATDETEDGDGLESDDALTGDDDTVIITPCEPNPCPLIAHSDGSCAIAEETFVCGCFENYSWNPATLSCDADTRRTDCTNIPENAHGIGDNSDGKFEQVWDGANWLPGSVVCTWECDNDFAEEGGFCINEKIVSCDEDNDNPANSHDIIADVTITYTTLGGWEAPADCAWECDDDFAEEGGFCINEKTVSCDEDNGNPVNSHDIVADVTIHYTTLGGWEAPADCGWECNLNYTWNGSECEADHQRVACTNIPEHAHGTGDNSDGQIEQVWDGDLNDWVPATDTCTWECNEHYLQNGDLCEPETRREFCQNIPQEHAHGIGDNSDGMFEQVWNGDTEAWEPATFACAWECDLNYTWDGFICAADHQWVACTNIPANAHGIGDNADGKFEQVWDGDSWEPATFDCAWECNEHYTWDGSLCVADTQRVDCTNIPANAHGTGDNADGQIDQTWDGDSWEPAADTCAWKCDKGYFLSETGDACEWHPIVYVNHAATGANDGSSWSNAFTNLSGALNFVIEGQEIWVARGTYHPDECPSSPSECADPRFRTFWLVPGVSLYGGFTGTETLREERDWAANETILSADINEDDLWDDINKTWLNRTDNMYHVFARGGDVMTGAPDRIDGFTIKGGQADLNDLGHSVGGGLSFTNRNLVVANCAFVGNVALESGGAISAAASLLSVENCSFDRNIAATGGAINAFWDSDLTITDSVFTGNRTAAPDNNQRGGAISFDSSLTVTGSDFVDNFSPREGAAISGTGSSGSTIVVDGCAFAQNSTSGDSDDDSIIRIPENSVVTVTSSSFTLNIGTPLRIQQSTLTVTDTLFENNSAVNGGAINAGQNHSTAIENCRFIGNEATRSFAGLANLGGAIFLGGLGEMPLLPVIPGLTAQIINSVFLNNKAGWHGGAIAVLGYPDLVVTNCTMEGNEANPNKDATPDPNAITFISSNGSRFNNSIIWDPMAMIPAGFMGLPITASNPIFSYSDVFGCGGSGAWVAACGTDGGGNIDANPLFIGGTGVDPLYLQETSPCVDAGSNALVPEGITTDILGSGRFNGTVDMGAYEWWE